MYINNKEYLLPLNIIKPHLDSNSIMDKCYKEEQVDLFHHPARMLVAGFSNSGKSELVARLVAKYHFKFSHIFVCGTTKHPLQKVSSIKNKLYLHLKIIDPLN